MDSEVLKEALREMLKETDEMIEVYAEQRRRIMEKLEKLSA